VLLFGPFVARRRVGPAAKVTIMRALFKTLFAAAMLLWPCLASATPLAYITDVQRSKVFVVDTATNSIAATIWIPPNLSDHVVVDPAGTRVYVQERGGLAVIDTATNTLAGRIATGGFLQGMDLSPTGTRLYVAEQDSRSLFVIDTGTNAVIAAVPLGSRNPIGVAVNSAGTRVYVANSYSNSVSVVDAQTNTLVTSISVGEEPVGVAVLPGDARAYVANRRSGTVSVIDTAVNAVVATVVVEGGPAFLRANFAGTLVYVTNQYDQRVSVIDTRANQLVGIIPVGDYPTGIDIHPDGTRLYVANKFSGSVSVIDTGRNTVVATITVGGVPVAAGHFISPRAPPAAAVVEYYHAALDHYFISWMPSEIAALDVGFAIRGWKRTGFALKAFTVARPGTSPVCRYYIPPALGDSHFFGRGMVECNETGQKNPSFELEDPAFMHMFLPVQGVCPANTTKVYRVFSNRPDANHRYMTDPAVREQMVARGWWAEGDGPDLVVMCAPQ
jgi:YVTN family beta-propeller protein